MRLAEYTDYTLRVLMYCAARPQQLVTIQELADYHAVSRNHLMKIVTDLGRQGVLETARGRGGGLRLLMDPALLRIGDVVRASESDFRLVECFDASTNQCRLSPTCRIKGLLSSALQAYFNALDSVTLADIVAPAPPPPPAGGTLHALTLRRRPLAAAPPAPRAGRKSGKSGKSGKSTKPGPSDA